MTRSKVSIIEQNDHEQGAYNDSLVLEHKSRVPSPTAKSK